MAVCIFCNIQEEVAKEYGIPVQFQRYWLWAKRQNHTYRPNRPLSHIEEAQSVNSHPCLRYSIYFLRFLLRLSVFFIQYGDVLYNYNKLLKPYGYVFGNIALFHLTTACLIM